MDPPPSGRTLTEEQLDRIAQNKKKAQELLKRKRPPEQALKPPGLGGLGRNTLAPPPAKQWANHFPNSSRTPHSPQLGVPSHVSHQSDKHPSLSASTAASQNYRPQPNHQNVSSVSSKTHHPSVPSSARNPYSSGAPSSAHLLPVSSERTEQVLKLKSVITATFVMLSRSRFKVQVPYDAEVIEIFRRMKTRLYGMYST